jgi:hypothetical protein
MQVALLIVEFILLFLISRALTQTMFLFFWKITRSRNFALSATTALLFPGTVIHELSHLFTAEILGVRTGGLTLVPEGLSKNEEGEAEIRTGSVSIAKTGPFRRALIGIAPVFVGLGALALIAYFIPGAWAEGQTLLLVLIGYLMFAVSNSLFSSPEDLVGFWPIAIIVGLLVAATWLSGIRIQLTGPILTTSNQIIQALTQSVGLVLALNMILLLTMRGLIVMTGKSKIR